MRLASVPREEVIGDESEPHFMRRVMRLLERRGWQLRYHTYDSTKSVAGFPDIVALRGDRGLALECKTQHGRVLAEQQRWCDAFDLVPGFHGRVVRPSDWAWIEEVAR